MGKGDKKRAQRMIDTQGARSQQYLSGVQNQLGNQNWNLGNQMWGSNGMLQPGTAVPNNGFTGPYQPNGGANTAIPRGSSPTGAQGAFGMDQFNQMFPGEQLTPEMLKSKEAELAKSGVKVLTNASGVSGKIQLPDGQIIDVIQGAGAGVNKRQWLGPNSGGGGAGQMGAGGVAGMNLNDYGNIMGRYEGFADTGGYSEQDKANIRQRAVSPIRSLYANANRELSRTKALQGGYSPGENVMRGRMNRELGQGMSDATGNAEANISQMVHAGKLAGMSGMAGMYGATPGLSNMFGNQQLQSQSNMLTGAGLQNQLGNNLMQNQIYQGGMEGFPWAKVIKGVGTGAMIAAGSSRTIKHDIKEISSKDVVARLKKLKLYEWKYRGEDTKHVGPIAEEFKKVMGVGDGKTLHLADVMGTSLALSKHLAEGGK